MLEKVSAGFRAMDVMVNDLLHFTSDRDPQLAELPLRKLLADVEAALAPQLAAQKIRFELKVPPQQTLRADREMLRRAVLNLVLNALDVMPQGGTLTVSSSVSPGGLELHVADSGPGLPADDPAAGLRAVLHHQAVRHGPGAGHRRADCRGPRRHGRRGQRRGTRCSGSRRGLYLEVPLPFVCRLFPGGCLMAANSHYPRSSSDRPRAGGRRPRPGPRVDGRRAAACRPPRAMLQFRGRGPAGLADGPLRLHYHRPEDAGHDGH